MQSLRICKMTTKKRALSGQSAQRRPQRCHDGLCKTILSEQGYTSRNLVNQIDSVLSEKDSSKSLPVLLHKTIDAVRNFGNFPRIQ